MVRSLIVRQVFRVADYALVVLLGIVIYQVIVLMLDLNGDTAGEVEGPQNADVNFQVASVGDRTQYDAIVNAKLFGPAGDLQKNDAPVEEPEDEGPITETDLPLQLLGASAAVDAPTDPSASAFIRNPSAPTVQKDATYWVADEIMAGVTLLEVYPRRVQIRNRINASPRRCRATWHSRRRRAQAAMCAMRRLSH